MLINNNVFQMNKCYCINFMLVGKGAKPQARAPQTTSATVGSEEKWMDGWKMMQNRLR